MKTDSDRQTDSPTAPTVPTVTDRPTVTDSDAHTGLMQASHSAVPRTTTTLGMPAVGGATGALVETPVGGGVRPPLEHPVGMPTSFLAPVLQGVPAAPAMQGLQLPLEHTSESAEADGGPRAVAAGLMRRFNQLPLAHMRGAKMVAPEE